MIISEMYTEEEMTIDDVIDNNDYLHNEEYILWKATENGIIVLLNRDLTHIPVRTRIMPNMTTASGCYRSRTSYEY